VGKLFLAVGAILLTALGQDQKPRREFQPFSATMQARHWTDTELSEECSITFARSKDGSWARTSDIEHPLFKDRSKRGIFSYRLDVPRRLYTSTEPFVRAATVFPIVEDKELERDISIYGSCDHLRDGTWKEVGRSTILNFDVIEVEVERTDRELRTKWVAPDLQCFALKETDLTDGELRMWAEAFSIETTEPPSRSFEPPDDYERLSPLELERRYQQMFPGNVMFGPAVLNVEVQYQRAVAQANAKKKEPAPALTPRPD